MKRKILSLVLAGAAVLSASAIPAKRIVKTVQQPDGTTVTLTLTGDERYHSYVTSDGLAVDINPQGYAVYRLADGLTEVYVHEAAERTADELSLISAKGKALQFTAQRAQAPRMLTMDEQPAPTLKRAAGSATYTLGRNDSQVPHMGVSHVPIILAQYTNVKFKDSDPNATFQNFFMGDDVSAKKFFEDMSKGLYNPEFHVIGPVNLPNNRSYYGSNDVWGNDRNVGQMVKDAINLADPTTDFSIFDNDGDGICDVVIVLYAGVGEASSGVRESVWPCQWDLASSGVGTVTTDGVKLTKFAVFNELNGTNQNKIDGVGTFCHEFSHCLGLPDFYETTYSNGYFGMNAWSLMDYGSYNNDGYTPIGYSAYEKAFMGWIDLIDGESNTYYTLPALNNPDDLKTDAVVLSSSNKSEYYILENRKAHGWDAYIDDEGLMITHVTYSASAWDGNTVNNSTPQRMTIMPADNRLSESTLGGDLWPNAGATEFTNTTAPSAKLNTGGYLNKPVTEITRDANTGEVSFWVDRLPAPALDAPAPIDPVVTEDAVEFAWSPVEVDGTDVTYTLQYWAKPEGVAGPQTWQNFEKGILTWKASGAYKSYSNYLNLGSTGDGGTVTSPEVAAVDGSLTVVLDGKRFGTDSNPQLLISVNKVLGGVASTQTVTLSSSRKIYKLAFNGLDTSASYVVVISNNNDYKRVNLYSAMIFGGDLSEMTDEEYKSLLTGLASYGAPAKVQETVTGGRNVVSGITETRYSVSGLEPKVYFYRVKAVPADETVALESAWSDIKEVDASQMSGIEEIAGDEMESAAYHINGGQLVATPGARLYSVSGTEVKALSAGRFAPAPGAYILVTPGFKPVKVVL